MPESNKFLLKEYELSYEQMRFYDTRHNDFMKYLFTLTSAVAAAQFAVFKFVQGPTSGFFLCQAFLGIVVFIATILLLLAMLQNRLYFVFIARQLNYIRSHYLDTEVKELDADKFFTSTDFPAFKPFSVHTYQLLGAALVSSLFAGVTTYGCMEAADKSFSIIISLLVIVLVAFTEIIYGITYLKKRSSQTADKAIHG